MTSLEALINLQESQMDSIVKALTNLQKLEQAKVTEAVIHQRMTSVNQIFESCRTLDAKIRMKVDDTYRALIPYFQDDVFGQCEDAYNEATDYMAEVLATCDSKPMPSAAVSSQDCYVHSTSGIDLPIFNVTSEDCETFRDRVTSTVLDDASLSNKNAPVCVYFPRGQFVNAKALLDQRSAATTISVSPTSTDKPTFSPIVLITKLLTSSKPIGKSPATTFSHLDGRYLAGKAPMSSNSIDIIIGANFHDTLFLE